MLCTLVSPEWAPSGAGIITAGVLMDGCKQGVFWLIAPEYL